MEWKGVIVVDFRWADKEGKILRKGLRIKCHNYRDSDDVGNTIKTNRIKDNISDFAECYLYGRRANLEKIENANALKYILQFPEASYNIQIKEKHYKCAKCRYCDSWVKYREIINGKCPNCNAPISLNEESKLESAVRLWNYGIGII